MQGLSPQDLSDSLFVGREGWIFANSDAPAPTLIADVPLGASARSLRLWVGPVDVALDRQWLRVMEVGRCTTQKSYIYIGFISYPSLVLQ